MKAKAIVVSSLSLLMLFGCANPGDTEQNTRQNNDSDTQPIQYESDKERRERQGERPQTIGDRGGYPQSDQRDTNASEGRHEDFSDSYVNESTDEIYDLISPFKEIKQAQVTMTDDRVVIALMLNDYNEDELRKKIVKEVEKVEPNKKVVIYTDDIHWNRMRNARSRLKTPDGRANRPSIGNE